MANIAVFLCLAAFASTVSGTIMPYTINCSEQEICLRDMLEWCLVGEKEPVFGHCEVQQRVCNGAQVDFSNSCFLPYPINCTQPRNCHRDMQAFCLEGVAEPVFGHCSIQNAICDNGAVYDPSAMYDPSSESCLNNSTSSLIR